MISRARVCKKMVVRSSGLSQIVSPTHPDLPICVYTHPLSSARANLINCKDERLCCTLYHARDRTQQLLHFTLG